MAPLTSSTLSPIAAMPHRAQVILMAAVARNGMIGRDNDLVWRDPQDAKHLREATMGSPVIMGRRTWDSLPERFRPLPGRRNIVVTRNRTWHARGAESAGSLEEALLHTQGSARVFVLGGAQLYAEALPLADALMLTEVEADLEGDVHFPPWDRTQFDVESRVGAVDAKGTPFAFVTYRRIRPHTP